MTNFPVRVKLVQKNTAKQNGSALMMALFIIVILTLLGGVLMKTLSSSSEAIAQEVLGTRAMAAANSAMQAELQQLFPLNSTANTCNAINNYNFSTSGIDVDGLYHCSAITSCNAYATHPTTGEVVFYRIKSTGKCGSGTLDVNSTNVVVSSRSIQVEARSL